MKYYLRKLKAIIDSIGAGIATRGFYIVCERQQIKDLWGDNLPQLERLQGLASDHGWRVTVHERNGWLLFTPDSRPASAEVANNRERLPDFAELFKSLWALEAIPARRRMRE